MVVNHARSGDKQTNKVRKRQWQWIRPGTRWFDAFSYCVCMWLCVCVCASVVCLSLVHPTEHFLYNRRRSQLCSSATVCEKPFGRDQLERITVSYRWEQKLQRAHGANLVHCAQTDSKDSGSARVTHPRRRKRGRWRSWWKNRRWERRCAPSLYLIERLSPTVVVATGTVHFPTLTTFSIAGTISFSSFSFSDALHISSTTVADAVADALSQTDSQCLSNLEKDSQHSVLPSPTAYNTQVAAIVCGRQISRHQLSSKCVCAQ